MSSRNTQTSCSRVSNNTSDISPNIHIDITPHSYQLTTLNEDIGEGTPHCQG